MAHTFFDRRAFAKVASGSVVSGAILSKSGKASGAKSQVWRLVMPFPESSIPGQTGLFWAKRVEEASNGRIKVEMLGPEHKIKPFESFDAVSSGKADVAIGSPMYWPKIRAFHFFSNIPFGLNAVEVSSWLRFGGGQELWDETYAQYNCKPFLAGSTGVQMGGWFNKKINDIKDFKSLKMRISGLGKEVLKRAGADTVLLPLSEVPKSLSSGKIEAAEFIAPVDDLRIEMFKAAKFYYWPGWHEPSTNVEATINSKVWERLPSDLKAVVQQTSSDAFLFMLGNYFHKNSEGLVSLVKEHNVKLEHFPSKVLGRLAKLTKEELVDIASESKLSQRIYDSYTNFRSMAVGWSQIGEEGFSSARSKVFSTF